MKMGSSLSTCSCIDGKEQKKQNILIANLDIDITDSNDPFIQKREGFIQNDASSCLNSVPDSRSLPETKINLNNFAILKTNGDTAGCRSHSISLNDEKSLPISTTNETTTDTPSTNECNVAHTASFTEVMEIHSVSNKMETKIKNHKFGGGTFQGLAYIPGIISRFIASVFASKEQETPQSLKVRGGILLHGCETPHDHFEKIRYVVKTVQSLNSADGLKAIGFEFRTVPCEQHLYATQQNGNCAYSSDGIYNQFNSDCDPVDDGDNLYNDEYFVDVLPQSKSKNTHNSGNKSVGVSIPTDLDNVSQQSNFDWEETLCRSDESESSSDLCNDVKNTSTAINNGITNAEFPLCRCHLCMRRLYHVETDTLIDDDNRKRFIADGDMYEIVSRLAQENTFDIMIEEGKLRWLTIDESSERGPIRALVNSDHPALVPIETRHTSKLYGRPTLIICTGRGKVRAGIFSRNHLICNGMELSTCLPYVREAQARSMNVFILDPNAHGERHDFNVFQTTIQHWCSLCRQCGSGFNQKSYILSHSASGGHLVRFLLHKDSKDHFMPYIEAIAFTDSTHNVQWAKPDDQTELYNLLQSNRCVYFRCGKLQRDTPIDNQWYLHPAGAVILTDSFWQHRFGTIKTMWAGTDQHSLTNWYSLDKIWEHFDEYLSQS